MPHREDRSALPFALSLLLAVVLAAPAAANDDVIAQMNDPANVVMPSITYNGWNYSLLDQITPGNVAELQIAWTWQVGAEGIHEAPPLVVGDTMYIVSPAPQNYVYALDLNLEGVIKWEFRPDMNSEQPLRAACCNDATRSLVYAEGKIFFNALDGQIFALDAPTGETLWRGLGADLAIAETTAGNMIVAGDILIAGNAGDRFGVRGKVQAFDINTGNLQWVQYNMGPDNEVGIYGDYTPFYPENRDSLSTWYGDSWRRGGGTVTGTFTFDPEWNLFYYTTGACAPAAADYRREWGVVTLDENGHLVDYHNNWCASVLARDATTGMLQWAYNLTPGDPWGLEGAQALPLVDDFAGTGRNAVFQAAANGWFYVWDRYTGELLADPWMHSFSNIILDVDLFTGRPAYDLRQWPFTSLEDRRRYTDADPGRGHPAVGDDYTGTEVEWCPGRSARNGQNDVYSPRTGLYYSISNSSCVLERRFEGEYVPGEPYTLRAVIQNFARWFDRGASPNQYAYAPRGLFTPEAGARHPVNVLEAIDPVYGETLWVIRHFQPSAAPMLGTATDLLFHPGNHDGTFRAYRADYGEELFSFRVGATFYAPPITYLGPDGAQYVAALSSSPSPRNPVAIDDAPADADRFARGGATLYVWALPESVAGN